MEPQSLQHSPQQQQVLQLDSFAQQWQQWQHQQQQVQQRGRLLPEQQLQRWCDVTWQLTMPLVSNSSRQPLRSHMAAPASTAQACPIPTDAAQLLWAASQLGEQCWPPAEWFQLFWATTTDTSSTSSSSFSSSCPSVLHHSPSSSSSAMLLQQASAQSLTMIMWAAVKMGQPPPVAWLMVAVPALQQQLAELQPAAACQLLYVLARAQHRPNPCFMQQLLCRLQLDSHQLQPRAFACVLWALGRLGYHPGSTWWATTLQHLEGLVGQLGQRELANVLYGLAALGVLQPGVAAAGSSSGEECKAADVDLGVDVDGSSSCSRSSQAGLLSGQLRGALLRRVVELTGDQGSGAACGMASALQGPTRQQEQQQHEQQQWQEEGASAGSSTGNMCKQLPLVQLAALLQ